MTADRRPDNPDTVSALDDAVADRIDALADRFYAARYEAVADGHEIPDRGVDPLTDEEEAVLDDAADDGFELLGFGAARATVAVDDETIVKFARWGDEDRSDGQVQNHRERRISEKAADEFRILPVVNSGDGDLWVAMPRVEPLSDSPELSGDPEVTDLVDHLSPLYEYIHSPEVNPQNIGRYQGELHLFDYGRPRVPLGDV